MNKYELISMAKEAMEFTDNFIEETKHYECEEVLVYLPDMLQDIVNDVDGFFEKSFCETEGANFFVVDADFFDAALDLEKPLVMNFASAHRPGGGFLNGAKAQEESLCRCSTLYKSISGDKVKEMYNYNNSGKNPCTSDYMLLSQNVYVFMDLRGDMLDVPFWASVVTVPAPNKRGAASNVPQDVLAHVMTERLKKMLFLAVRKGYKNLVLGAWRCGAFGNDTRRVASYFYNLFFVEYKLDRFFEHVVFAILNDEEKIEIFKEVFGEKIKSGHSLYHFLNMEKDEI